MKQNYQPNFDNYLQGESNQTTDEQILAAVRKIMTDDKSEHPETAAPSPNRSGLVAKGTNRNSLTSLLLNTLRKKVSAPKTAA
ncbi:MAG: hypothetical protein KUG62_03160 [Rhodobacteraceae bacterium]|nr:hypothetical protein [Paracoccaceae bacterium]